MRNARIVALGTTLLAAALLAASPASAWHRPRVSVHIFGGWGYGGPYYPAPGYPYSPYRIAPPNYALVDTDVSPESATIFLDGEEVGIADDYDGFPDYLEVGTGRHVVEFRSPGHRTLRVNLNARAGALYRVARSLREGDTKDVDVRVMGSPAPPGARTPRYRPRPPSARAPEDERENESEDHDERQGSGADRGEDREHDEYGAAGSGPPNGRESPPQGGGPAPEGASPGEGDPRPATEGTLFLRLRPADAAVYIDGSFRGAGASLGGPDGLKIAAGRHTIEVVKPGFSAQRAVVNLRRGETRRLTLELQPTNASDE